MRAGGHHDAPAGLDDPIIDGHPAGRHDAPLAPYESAPLALEALHRHPAVPAVGRLVTDPRSHRAPIGPDGGVAGHPREAAGCGQLARPDLQRKVWDSNPR